MLHDIALFFAKLSLCRLFCVIYYIELTMHQTLLCLMIFLYMYILFVVKSIVFFVSTFKWQPSMQCKSMSLHFFRLCVSYVLTTYANIIYVEGEIYAINLIKLSGDVHPNPGPREISLCHSNIRGMVINSADNPMYKLEELYSNVCIEQQVDFIFITETHLTNNTESSDLPFPPSEYTMYRRDRPTRGGGVCILATNKLVHRVLIDLSHPDLENIWIEVKVENKIFLFGVIYRPPNPDNEVVDIFMDNLSQNITDIFKRKSDSIFLLGDFNDRCILWDSDHNTSDFKNKLRDFVASCGLFQIINEPTRITTHCTHLLDLILTDSPGYVERSHV